MNKLLSLIFALCIGYGSKGQEIFAEFDVTSNQIGYLNAFEVNDRIFISFWEQKAYRNYWVNGNGEKREVALKIPSGAPVSAVVQKEGKIFYYFLHKINGKLALQAMEQESESSEIKLSPPIFLLPGKLIGLHASTTALTVLSYLQKENQIRVLDINGSAIRHDRYFDMPFDLSKHIKNNSGFITANEVASVEQGSKTFKVYREEESIISSIDENEPGLENKKTTIMKLHVASGKKEVYEIMRGKYDEFVSFYYHNKVYQFGLSAKRLSCDVVDLSGKLLFSRQIEKQQELKNHKIIVQRGKSVAVGYTSIYDLFMNQEFIPSILVERAPGENRLRLTLGAAHYYAEVVFIPIPLFDFSLLFTITVVTSSNSNARYFTFIGNCETGFDFEPAEANSTPSMRRVIDAYEMSRASDTSEEKSWDLLYKGYLPLQDGVLGIYHSHDKKLTLLKYRLP